MAGVGTKFHLKRIVPKLYLVTFDNEYDLAMTFCRYQEFYESPKFRGQFFKMDDFMRWYSKKFGDGAFTYPADFNGFNIPGKYIVQVMRRLATDQYDYQTKYDYLMASIIYHIWDTLTDIERETADFYLIGVHTEKSDPSTVQHEIAHGLYTINPSYRTEVDTLLKALPVSARKYMNRKLKARGYASNVYNDETHAYLATGLHKSMTANFVKKLRKPFQDLFKLYAGGVHHVRA